MTNITTESRRKGSLITQGLMWRAITGETLRPAPFVSCPAGSSSRRHSSLDLKTQAPASTSGQASEAMEPARPTPALPHQVRQVGGGRVLAWGTEKMPPRLCLGGKSTRSSAKSWFLPQDVLAFDFQSVCDTSCSFL